MGAGELGMGVVLLFDKSWFQSLLMFAMGLAAWLVLV